MESEQPLAKKGWSKFPCSSPLDRRSVKVMVNGIQKRGLSIETPRYPMESYSGVAIKIGDQVFDSNNVLWWKYESENNLQNQDNDLRKAQI